MRYEQIFIDIERLEEMIKERGLTKTQFAKLMWNKEDHRGIKEFARRPNMRIETAMKICNILDISLDELFDGSDKAGNSPNIVGNQNIINSSIVSNDPAAMRAEIRTLRALIKEKDLRIDELKETNTRLCKQVDFFIKLGQNSDSK